MKSITNKIYESFFTNIGNSKDVRGALNLQNLQKKLEGMSVEEFCKKKLGFRSGSVPPGVFVRYLSLSAEKDDGLYSISNNIYINTDRSITLKDILEKRKKFCTWSQKQMVIDLSEYDIEQYKKYKKSQAYLSGFTSENIREDVIKLFKYELENPNDLNMRDCFYIRCKSMQQNKVYLNDFIKMFDMLGIEYRVIRTGRGTDSGAYIEVNKLINLK